MTCLDRAVRSPHFRRLMAGLPTHHGKLLRISVLAGVGLMGTAAIGLSPAVAATATSTFTVSATVAATCLISAAPLAFGTYTGVLLAGTGSVSVTCTTTTPYNVGLSAGLAPGATVTTRQMTGPATALLGYVLTQDAAHATNWGNTIGSWMGGSGNGAAQVITVYGQIAAGQFVVPGTYTDTITATVNY